MDERLCIWCGAEYPTGMSGADQCFCADCNATIPPSPRAAARIQWMWAKGASTSSYADLSHRMDEPWPLNFPVINRPPPAVEDAMLEAGDESTADTAVAHTVSAIDAAFGGMALAKREAAKRNPLEHKGLHGPVSQKKANPPHPALSSAPQRGEG